MRAFYADKANKGFILLGLSIKDNENNKYILRIENIFAIFQKIFHEKFLQNERVLSKAQNSRSRVLIAAGWVPDSSLHFHAAESKIERSTRREGLMPDWLASMEKHSRRWVLSLYPHIHNIR